MWVSTGPKRWGSVMVDTGYVARVPVRKRPQKGDTEHEFRDFQDACYLTGIAHLARLGLVKLRSSGELQIEQWEKPVGMIWGHTIFGHSAFNGVEIALVDKPPDMVMGPSWMNMPSLKEQQRERLGNSKDEIYAGLLRQLGRTSSQDAWHIRTAEVHGMFCFLTVDYTLMRNMAAQGLREPIRSLKTRVLSPTQLGKTLGLFPLNPRFTSHIGASIPVRADLHMPGSSRKRNRKNKPD
jgi:hypothetical protein